MTLVPLHSTAGVEVKEDEHQQNPVRLAASAKSVSMFVLDAMPTSGASLHRQAASCPM